MRGNSRGTCHLGSATIRIAPYESILVQPQEMLMTIKEIVHSDPDIMGGTPVFVGTRVPVRILLDYLEGGDPLEEFLENYPSVSREQAVAFIEEAGKAALAQIA